MGKYKNDKRVVLTLDAGGNSLRFNAMKGEEFILETLTLPSNANNLDLCLETMVTGFKNVINQLGDAKPEAISFAFPGPADYPAGIIGGFLPNFPSFRDGVALGPYLKEVFGIPVFINNDGDLFAFGEALSGALPEVNEKLAAAGSAKRFHNLIGYTFGTGFGIGCVINGQLNRGDNSCVETYCLANPHINGVILEDSVAIRAVKRVYSEQSGVQDPTLTPKDIYDIAEGTRPGKQKAAKAAFEEMGRVAGPGHRPGRSADGRHRGDWRRHLRISQILHALPAGRDARHRENSLRRCPEPRPDEGLQPGQPRRIRRLCQGRGPRAQGLRHRQNRHLRPPEANWHHYRQDWHLHRHLRGGV